MKSLLLTVLSNARVPDNGTLWLPTDASVTTKLVDPWFYFILYLSAALFVAMIAVMVYFVIRHRRRSPEQKTSPVAGSTVIEFVWSAVPTLLLVAIFYAGFQGWMGLQVAPSDAMEVRVVARRWNWQFVYPQTGLKSASLVVPLNKAVKLVMYSEDVIHSFWVPAFRIKKDVLPERYSTVWFQATKIGVYDVRCAEYCGTKHSMMIATVDVRSQADYDKWVSTGGGLASLSPVKYGESLFKLNGCNACHTTDKARTKLIGPPLYGVYGTTETMTDGTKVKVDENYIRRSIVSPQEQIVKGYESQNMNPSRI